MNIKIAELHRRCSINRSVQICSNFKVFKGVKCFRGLKSRVCEQPDSCVSIPIATVSSREGTRSSMYGLCRGLDAVEQQRGADMHLHHMA